MNKRKAFLAILFAAIMVTLPIASAYAAPVAQTVTPATCTVQSITPSADNTTVSVTCAEGNTLTLSAADALALSLVTKNADGSLTAVPVNGQVITPPAEVDPCAAPTTTSDTTGGTTTTTTTTTGDESTGGTGGSLNPVGQALCGFFGLDYQTIQDAHTGYGVIAQACFMAQLLSVPCSDVLKARSSGDYSAFGVTNWGQLRKAVFGALLDKGEQSSCNLGAIMSGRDKDSSYCASSSAVAPESVKQHGKGNHGDHGNNGHHGKP